MRLLQNAHRCSRYWFNVAFKNLRCYNFLQIFLNPRRINKKSLLTNEAIKREGKEGRIPLTLSSTIILEMVFANLFVYATAMTLSIGWEDWSCRIWTALLNVWKMIDFCSSEPENDGIVIMRSMTSQQSAANKLSLSCKYLLVFLLYTLISLPRKQWDRYHAFPPLFARKRWINKVLRISCLVLQYLLGCWQWLGCSADFLHYVLTHTLPPLLPFPFLLSSPPRFSLNHSYCMSRIIR